MIEIYVLEKKNLDKMSRNKKTEFVGVFKSLEELENKKQSILQETKSGCKIEFDVHVSERIF